MGRPLPHTWGSPSPACWSLFLCGAQARGVASMSCTPWPIPEPEGTEASVRVIDQGPGMTKALSLPSVATASKPPFWGLGAVICPLQKVSQPGWGLQPLSHGGGPWTPKHVSRTTGPRAQISRCTRGSVLTRGARASPSCSWAKGQQAVQIGYPQTWHAGLREVAPGPLLPWEALPCSPPGSQERPSGLLHPCGPSPPPPRPQA